MSDRNLKDRLEAIRSFEVIDYSGVIPSVYLSTHKETRLKQYEYFRERGIELPPYDSIKRKNLSKKDLKVFLDDWLIIFKYKNIEYKLTIKAGAITDDASVPTAFVFMNVTKHNQYVSIPAAVHDCLFALHLLSFEDANNVFSGLLRWNKIPKLALARYMMGVRSPVGKMLYKNNDPSKHWLKDFVDFEILEMEL